MAEKNVPAKAETRPQAGYPTYPFTGLREEMNRVFDNFFGDSFLTPFSRGLPPPALAARGGFMAPRVDVKETDKAVVVSAELPGIDEKDVELVLKDGVLTLKGEKKYEKDQNDENVHTMERSYGSFRRSFQIPDSVDADKIDASFDKGVLTITLPRKPDAVKTEKRIKIGK